MLTMAFMNTVQRIETLKQMEHKVKRNLDVAESAWEPSSPFLELARKQATKVMEEEMTNRMRHG